MTDSKVSLKDVYDAVSELRIEIRKNYVTKEEFWPVRAIVYGGAGLILAAVVGYWVSQSVR